MHLLSHHVTHHLCQRLVICLVEPVELLLLLLLLLLLWHATDGSAWLEDDLMLEDWKEEEVADLEQLAVAGLVRDSSGYYSDDFEALSDEEGE